MHHLLRNQRPAHPRVPRRPTAARPTAPSAQRSSSRSDPSAASWARTSTGSRAAARAAARGSATRSWPPSSSRGPRSRRACACRSSSSSSRGGTQRGGSWCGRRCGASAAASGIGAPRSGMKMEQPRVIRRHSLLLPARGVRIQEYRRRPSRSCQSLAPTRTRSRQQLPLASESIRVRVSQFKLCRGECIISANCQWYRRQWAPQWHWPAQPE